MRQRILIALSVLSFLGLPVGMVLAADAVDEITAKRLEAVHQAILKLKLERREVPRTGPLHEYRANLHVHSAFSHDSRGKIDEIVTAAKAVGTHVLMFTEHRAHVLGAIYWLLPFACLFMHMFMHRGHHGHGHHHEEKEETRR